MEEKEKWDPSWRQNRGKGRNLIKRKSVERGGPHDSALTKEKKWRVPTRREGKKRERGGNKWRR